MTQIAVSRSDKALAVYAALTDRTWRVLEPDFDGGTLVYTSTDSEILTYYWPQWCERMIKVGKLPMVTEENCIQDWVCTHWACEL